MSISGASSTSPGNVPSVMPRALRFEPLTGFHMYVTFCSEPSTPVSLGIPVGSKSGVSVPSAMRSLLSDRLIIPLCNVLFHIALFVPESAEFMKRTVCALALRAYMGMFILCMVLFQRTEFITSAYVSIYRPPVCEAFASVLSVAVGQLLFVMVFCSSTPPLLQYTAPLLRLVLLDTTDVESIRYSGWFSPSLHAPLWFR